MKNIVLSSLCILPFLFGCAGPKEELGEDLRKSLGVSDTTTADTEQSIERSYDPLVILKRAEAFYEKEEYLEAAAEYQHFLDLHSTHRLADYVLFKLGMSRFRQFESIDRDPTPTHQALSTFERLLQQYPHTAYADEAKNHIKDCNDRLAAYQLYVGEFYYKKGAYPAAIRRLQRVASTYPDYPELDEAMYYLALSYEGDGKQDEASKTYRDFLTRYPDSPYLQDVRDRLEPRSPP
jgi:outer membrane protein assembly factor BamD